MSRVPWFERPSDYYDDYDYDGDYDYDEDGDWDREFGDYSEEDEYEEGTLHPSLLLPPLPGTEYNNEEDEQDDEKP